MPKASSTLKNENAISTVKPVTANIHQMVKESIDSTTPFPQERNNKGLRLAKSRIPADQRNKIFVDIDEGTNIAIAVKAVSCRVTTDEYVRRLLWLAAAS